MFYLLVDDILESKMLSIALHLSMKLAEVL